MSNLDATPSTLKRLRHYLQIAKEREHDVMPVTVSDLDTLLAAHEEALAGYVALSCAPSGALDSMCSAGITEAIEQLEALGRVRITERRAKRWVIAEWVRDGA